VPLIDDVTAEQVLAGTTVARDLAPDLMRLAPAVDALRQEARRPVSPSPELATLMSVGFRPHRAAPQPPPAHHARPPGPLVAALARITRVRTAVAAAGGVLLAVGGVATAGFAEALPPEVQHRFEVVVEAVTPYEFKEKPAGKGEFGTAPPSEHSSDPDAPGVTDQDQTGGEPSEGLSDQPSEDVDGPDVSEGVQGRPGPDQQGPPEGGPPGHGPGAGPPGHGPGQWPPGQGFEHGPPGQGEPDPAPPEHEPLD
jgi:hypothetical protein